MARKSKSTKHRKRRSYVEEDVISDTENSSSRSRKAITALVAILPLIVALILQVKREPKTSFYSNTDRKRKYQIFFGVYLLFICILFGVKSIRRRVFHAILSRRGSGQEVTVRGSGRPKRKTK